MDYPDKNKSSKSFAMCSDILSMSPVIDKLEVVVAFVTIKY